MLWDCYDNYKSLGDFNDLYKKSFMSMLLDSYC